MNRLTKMVKVIRQLGLPKLWLYAAYRIGLGTGHYKRVMPSLRDDALTQPGPPPLASFPAISPADVDLALLAADEVRAGKVRLFNGDPLPLDLTAGASDRHWSELERRPSEQDLKFIWEPGRLGWAISLARAYAFSGDPVYVRDFWDNVLQFLAIHPPNLGCQWQSAQEVALRLMALVFCDRVVASSPDTPLENRQRLWHAVAEHAQRIPPTLIYARSQNNNHLLSEAAGLYTAGHYLPDHPKAAQWRELGWRWLNWGFQNQIDEFGTYTQHSTTYHRLMLQLALFTDGIRREAGAPDWPEQTRTRFAAATRWLWSLTDPDNGRVPNLGANDGAYIFPLTSRPFADFRPVVAAAGRAFLDLEIYDDPSLNEMTHWLGLEAKPDPSQRQPQASDMLRVESGPGRAFLHAARFTNRPSHADQLHVDLWWQGVNIALDPGTYLYNASPPWENALGTARVHNTLTVDGEDQMRRAGRFLWLDWAQAEFLAHEMDEQGGIRCLTAEHDGYKHLGVLHQRTLTAVENGWEVLDRLLPYGRPADRPHRATLTWLLPDWDWQVNQDNQLHLTGPHFTVDLALTGVESLNLYRAGERLKGDLDPEPIWGWVSPTYGKKQPALLLKAAASGALPLEIRSNWTFGE